MKRLLGLAIGAAIGAGLGHSQVLCTGGECAAIGSWYGGAILGGFLGLMLAGGCPACASTSCRTAPPDHSPDGPPARQE